MVPDHSSNDEFPPLPVRHGVELLSQRPTQHLKPSSATTTADPQIECSNQADNTSGFTLGNPVLYRVFLVEVINQEKIYLEITLKYH